MSAETRHLAEVLAENQDLRARLQEALDTLEAIQQGEVDALVVSTPQGEQIYTLKSAEQPYRLLVEKMQEGAVTLLRDGTILYCNARFAELAGMPLEEVIGSCIRSFFDAADQPAMEALLQDESGRGEFRLRTAGDRSVPVFLSATTTVHEDITQLCLVVTDLTEQKRNEAIVAAEKLARSILENAGDGIVVCDPEGRIIRASRRAHLLCGTNPLRKRFREVLQLSAPHDGDTGEDTIGGILGGASVQGVEQELLRSDGQKRDVLISAAALRGEDGGEFLGSVITLTDITDRKQTERAVRRSRAMLAWAERIAAVGSWEMIIESGELIWSDQTYRLFGSEPKGFVPTQDWFQAHVYPEDRELVQEAIKKTVSTGAPYDLEFRITTIQSAVRWVRARAEITADESGRPERLAGAAIDITESKIVEQELAAARLNAEQAKDVAESANAAKDHFLAVLSHELRTPLTPVLMTASACESDPSLPATIREDMGMIRRSIELEVDLINDLLDVNRIARGKLELCMEELDAHAAVSSAAEVCRAEADLRGQVLNLHLGAEEHHVRGDASRLQQVFWNLVKNAVKFTPRGGRIEARSSNPRPGVLRVEVSDTGIGIEPEVLPRLFQAFEQAGPQTTRQFGGLGLGLAISRSLVEMHGGEIRVESAGPALGATFIVELPALARPIEAQGGADPRWPRASGRALRVLVVEDHETSAEVLARLLERTGHEVKTADRLATALSIANAETFDLLVSDLGLPDGSGLELMRQLRLRRPGLRAIALSGYGMESDILRSKEAGFSEHLIKPVDIASLQESINRIMAQDE